MPLTCQGRSKVARLPSTLGLVGIQRPNKVIWVLAIYEPSLTAFHCGLWFHLPQWGSKEVYETPAVTAVGVSLLLLIIFPAT